MCSRYRRMPWWHRYPLVRRVMPAAKAKAPFSHPWNRNHCPFSKYPVIPNDQWYHWPVPPEATRAAGHPDRAAWDVSLPAVPFAQQPTG
jgi:hypothetical protein